MKNIAKQHEDLEKRIVVAQKKLKEKHPNHVLLGLVEVDDIGIQYRASFGGLYEGMTKYAGLNKYISDLNKATQQIKGKEKYWKQQLEKIEAKIREQKAEGDVTKRLTTNSVAGMPEDDYSEGSYP